jgi:hypothetical protein
MDFAVLHGMRSARAALRSAGSGRDPARGLAGAGCGPDQVGLGQQLTRYAIGTRAQPALVGFHRILHRPVMRHLTRRAGRPCGARGGPEQRLGETEDSERLEPAGQAERRDVMLILQRKRHTKVL